MGGAALLSSLKERFDIDGELNSIASRSRSEIVLTSLQPRLPGMEVHGRHLVKLRVLLVEVQTLRLANVGASCHSLVHHTLLLDFPDGLVHLTESFRDLRDVLHTSVVCYDLVLDRGCPKAKFEQVSDQMLVHADEFA